MKQATRATTISNNVTLIKVSGSLTLTPKSWLCSKRPTLKADSIALSHPLGGCIIGQDASKGTVDEYGRVFDKTKTGSRPLYKGLYIADGSIVPTALGVNPSLTISALALRIADKIIEELPQ